METNHFNNRITNGYEFTFVLYVYPGNKSSDSAIAEVHWGPNELSADGKIKFQDIRALKKVYGSYPQWLTGVPTLVNVETERQWTGNLCITKLKQWKKEWNNRPRKTPAGAGVDVPTTLAHDPNKRIELPPDPMKIAMEEAGWKNEIPKPREELREHKQSSVDINDGTDLMSQLKARMPATARDIEPTFNFPPPDRDPFDPKFNDLSDVRHVDVEKVTDDDIRTVQFTVSLPKEPKTPTRPSTTRNTTTTPTTQKVSNASRINTEESGS